MNPKPPTIVSLGSKRCAGSLPTGHSGGQYRLQNPVLDLSLFDFDSSRRFLWQRGSSEKVFTFFSVLP
jgi:hypothetical protein